MSQTVVEKTVEQIGKSVRQASYARDQCDAMRLKMRVGVARRAAKTRR